MAFNMGGGHYIFVCMHCMDGSDKYGRKKGCDSVVFGNLSILGSVYKTEAVKLYLK